MQSKKNVSTKTAIEVNNLWKLFHHQKQKTFKEMVPALFGGGRKKIIDSFWALKDIDFKITEGETWGIIGVNGSGKSTMLKVLAGVTKPTKGSVKVNGRVAPLIELGAGFHPELTGKENVYLNGTILGLSKKEIDEAYPEIISFADIGYFIDQPVKHYSSGMYLRLAFAVAVNTKPDVLLVDEILAVGDAAFQNKCLNKVRNFQKEGKTILLVSHDLNMVRSACDQVVWLNKGKVEAIGKADQVIDQFIYADTLKTNKNIDDRHRQAVKNQETEIIKVELKNKTGKEAELFYNKQPLKINIGYQSKVKEKQVAFGLSIYMENGERIYGTNSLLQKKLIDLQEKGEVSFVIDNLQLLSGQYYISAAIHSADGKYFDYVERAAIFNVNNLDNTATGVFNLEAKFEGN